MVITSAINDGYDITDAINLGGLDKNAKLTRLRDWNVLIHILVMMAEWQLPYIVMDRWRAGRRSLILDNRASQYIGKLFCSGPFQEGQNSVENSPWKLSDSFTKCSGSPRVSRGRRTRSASGTRQRPVSLYGPLLEETYAETKSFLKQRYHPNSQEYTISVKESSLLKQI